MGEGLGAEPLVTAPWTSGTPLPNHPHPFERYESMTPQPSTAQRRRTMSRRVASASASPMMPSGAISVSATPR